MILLFDNDELRKYHLNRNDILLSSNTGFEIDFSGDRTHQTALDIFPNSLFNKKVRLSDESFVGFAMEMTDKKIIVFGDYDQIYDIPKSKADEYDNSIALDMEWNEFATYKNDNTQ
jgi:hypothetical protein